MEFEFRVILLFWVVEICSRSSIPFKEMLVCPPPPGIDAEENRLNNYRLFENVGLQKRIRYLRVNVQLHILYVLSCDIIKK